MSFSRTHVPGYFLKSGNHMSLSAKSTEADCRDVLGFHQGLPVIEGIPPVTETRAISNKQERVMDEDSSKLCGKRVILNTGRKVIILNAKNLQIPLTQCTPLKVGKEMLRQALEIPAKEKSTNENPKDYTYQESQDKAESLSHSDKRNSSELRTGIACSDFQEFEAKFYREIAHKDSVLSHRINSNSEDDIERARSSPEFDEPEFVHIPQKVYGRQRNLVASRSDGGTPGENHSTSNNNSISNRSKSAHAVMGKIKHFKDKNNQESQSTKLISDSEASASTSTSKMRPKQKMSNKRSLIRREVERCLMQQRRLKKPAAKIRTVSTQTSASRVSTSSTQTEPDLLAVEGSFINHLLSDDDLFIRDNGPDTNFGQGPIIAPIRHVEIKNGALLDISGKFAAMNTEPYKFDDNFGVNSQVEHEKLMFFQCLNNCTEVKTMGNLNIHLAVSQNDVAEVQRQCLALRVRQRSVDAFNDNDMTPLHLAVINDCLPQIVHLLLKFGADITLTDQDGNNPLHLAVTAGAEVILEMLLAVARQKNFKVDLYNFEGFTPLMLATLEGNVAITKMLLDCKASPNLRDQKSGRTPLFHAVESNNTELVRLLLRYKANTRISNFFGTSTHEAIFELDSINQEIKSMVIGKDLFQNRNKAGEKRRRAPVRKEKQPTAAKKPKLKIVKMLKKVVT